MRLLLTFSIAWMMLLNGSKALAYPVFFTCNADKSLGTVLTPPELAKRLKALVASYGNNQAATLEHLCTDVNSCARDLGQLMDLARATQGLEKAEVQSVLKEIAAKSGQQMGALKGFLKVPEKDMEFFEAAYRMGAETYECRQSSTELLPSSMEAWNVDSETPRVCAIGNFHHSPYMYIAGERFSGRQSSGMGERPNSYDRATKCSAIDAIIEKSVAAGQDPLAVLAIAYMEQGTTIEKLYLDPIGIVGVLGCPMKKVPKDSPKINMTSYESYFEVKLGVVKTPRAAELVQNYLKIKGIPTEPKESFLCAKTDKYFTRIVHSKIPRNEDSCCLSVPVTWDNKAYDTENMIADTSGTPASDALKFASFENYFRDPLSKSIKGKDPLELPARRLQRFNGYTHLMGNTEEVPGWRAGIDMYKTPTYGYQAMDFIVNSLMTNPYIMAKIKMAESKVGLHSPSVLCEDLKPGSYALDNMKFFNRHRNAPRMREIAAKANFGSLSKGEKRVFAMEMKEIFASFRKNEMKFTELSEKENKEFAEAMVAYGNYDAALNTKDLKVIESTFHIYKKMIYPHRQTVAAASRMTKGYSWEEMTDSQLQDLLEVSKEKFQIINGLAENPPVPTLDPKNTETLVPPPGFAEDQEEQP